MLMLKSKKVLIIVSVFVATALLMIILFLVFIKSDDFKSDDPGQTTVDSDSITSTEYFVEDIENIRNSTQDPEKLYALLLINAENARQNGDNSTSLENLLAAESLVPEDELENFQYGIYLLAVKLDRQELVQKYGQLVIKDTRELEQPGRIDVQE